MFRNPRNGGQIGHLFRRTPLFSAVSTAALLAVCYLVGTLVEGHFIKKDLNEFDGTTTFVRDVLPKAESRGELNLVPQLLGDALVGHPGQSGSKIGPEVRVMFASLDSVFPHAPSLPGRPSVFPANATPWPGKAGDMRFEISATG